MRRSSIVLMIIGHILVFLQFFVYVGTGVFVPPLYESDSLWITIQANSGRFIGHNFFGLVGLLFIIIALIRNSKLNTPKDMQS